jgi:hypothetical protein
MLLKTLAVTFTLLAAILACEDDDCTVTSDVVITIESPFFDLIPSSPLVMDIYTCDDEAYLGDVIFAVGAPLFDAFGGRAGKLAWSKLSARLAKRGYRVSILERPHSLSSVAPPSHTFVLPSDFDRAIAYHGFPSTVYVGGHSFGGSQALLYISGLVPGPPFTLPSADIPPQIPDPSVKGALVSGESSSVTLVGCQVCEYFF